MIRLKEAFIRNIKLASMVLEGGKKKRKYKVDSSILHSPVTSLSYAMTPKKSNVSFLTENIDFDLSHSNETNNETKDNQIEVLETGND
eukprot:1504350-Ditylum_brightwellii.AAC.1